ncbi:MAG: hypothetical protein E5Y10_09270 [Mesorhizobium sp.]|uniref:hypothetical protein n=1 Tax=Mesorhizobium sp. TaxID=1871066 RepID=UPI00120935AE|nr:hypothetical protein [Mesorhizobium sp.]TIN40405.1 MAG: hypothetical protein E5Y13_11485 [Mesorhizobium sp.]TJU90627.1 MAG: hypothetical protein E5Y10_09270 [Mesorhizobium sp.]
MIAPAYWYDGWRTVIASVGASTAAFAVVGAALISYEGAVAKVRNDRETERLNAEKRSDSLALRAQLAAEILESEADAVIDALLQLGETHTMFSHKTVYVADTNFEQPKELEVYWDSILDLPPECAQQLKRIKAMFATYSRLHNGFKEIHSNPTAPTSETELRLTALSNCAKRIRAAAAELGAILAQSRTHGSAAARSIV